MKTSYWLSFLVALVPTCACAQVTVNPAALQQLQGLPQATPSARKQSALAKPVVGKPAAHPSLRPRLKVLSPTKPTKPPPSAKEQAAPVPPPPLPAKPAAWHVARIKFAQGKATLPTSAAATLKPFCTSGTQVQIVAHAPSDPSDPSGAMRLSLNRAFAIRDALAACGVPTQNIIPRAAGNVPGADDNEALIGASAAP